jgi:hypothetical protein
VSAAPHPSFDEARAAIAVLRGIRQDRREPEDELVAEIDRLTPEELRAFATALGHAVRRVVEDGGSARPASPH